jgi:hypothetical protein
MWPPLSSGYAPSPSLRPALDEHTIKPDFDVIVVDEQIRFLNKPQSEAAKSAASPARAGGGEPGAGGHVKDAPE